MEAFPIRDLKKKKHPYACIGEPQKIFQYGLSAKRRCSKFKKKQPELHRTFRILNKHLRLYKNKVTKANQMIEEGQMSI